MHDGMIVRRVWTRDDEEWLAREEPWVFSKYGRDGTVRDIYVYDDEIGLEIGEYSLSLYIDGVLQDASEEAAFQSKAVFWVIQPDLSRPVPSPDKSNTALIQFGGILMIEDSEGNTRELASVPEISGISWFPNGRNLLYVDRDRSKQVDVYGDLGITHRLWVLDIVTGEQHIIGTSGENFHSPVISQSGNNVAVLSGATHREGCSGSPTLAILELDNELRRQGVLLVDDFLGMPGSTSGAGGIVSNDNGATLTWVSDTRLSVDLHWVCRSANDNPDGTYILDIRQKLAVKVD